MKLHEVLTKTIQFFKDKGLESARLDAELLFAHALKIPRVSLYIKYDQPLSEQELNACRELVKRRVSGEPVAYIVQEKGFYGLTFKVNKGVLVPRPETEQIVDIALDFLQKNKIENPRLLDLGAGSGCIGLSILKNYPSATLISVEKSEDAVEIIKENIAALNLAERVTVIHSSVEDLNWSTLEQFDCILSNPPYIDSNDSRVQKSVREFEPALALFAPENGLQFLKSWALASVKNLKTPGLMLFEMGLDQGSQMKTHFESLKTFKTVEVQKDLSGLDRLIKGVR